MKAPFPTFTDYRPNVVLHFEFFGASSQEFFLSLAPREF